METFEAFFQKWIHDPIVEKLMVLFVLFVIVGILNKIVKKRINLGVQDTNTRYRAKKFNGFVSFLLCLLITGIVFSNKLGGITVVFGVAGAGVAFALQEVIVSFAGWFAITFGNIFKIGDRISLAGIRGDVIDVGILKTTVMECGDWVKGDLYNGRIVRISNSFVFKEPVFNYSADFPFLWDEITIPIKYGSDLKIARGLIKSCADSILDSYEKTAVTEWKTMVRKYAIEDAQIDNMVTLTADENWVTFTLRYVTNFKSRRSTKDLLFTSILEKIGNLDGNVQIAGATLDVTLVRE